MNKLDMLLQMAETQPDNPYIHYILGQELAENNQLDRANHSLKEALRLADDVLVVLIQESLEGISKQQAIVQAGPKLHVLNGGAYQEEEIPTENTRLDYQTLAGLDELKHTMTMRLKQPAKYASLYKQFGHKPAGGFILYGPPGCGKSAFIEATANEFDMALVRLSVPTVIDPFYGQSLLNVENLFEEAHRHPRAILMIEDLDTFAYHRAKSSFELRNIIDQVVREIDRCTQESSSVLIMGITDIPWDIDPAIRRAGRLDQIFFVPPPAVANRHMIFKQALQNKPTEDDVQTTVLAQKTDLFSGADIQSVVSSAAEKVIARMIQNNTEDQKISQDDLLQSIQQHYASTTDWLINIANYVRFANQSGFYNDVKKYLEDHTTYLSE